MTKRRVLCPHNGKPCDGGGAGFRIPTQGWLDWSADKRRFAEEHDIEPSEMVFPND